MGRIRNGKRQHQWIWNGKRQLEWIGRQHEWQRRRIGIGNLKLRDGIWKDGTAIERQKGQQLRTSGSLTHRRRKKGAGLSGRRLFKLSACSIGVAPAPYFQFLRFGTRVPFRPTWMVGSLRFTLA